MWWIKPNKIEEKERWHKWFAWHPVEVYTYPDGAKKIIWLQYVWRCGEAIRSFDGVFWEWEYKEIK